MGAHRFSFPRSRPGGATGLSVYCALLLGGISILNGSGCSTLFDSPSMEGVQVVKSVAGAVITNGNTNSEAQSSSGVLDLTRNPNQGQSDTACAQGGNSKIQITSSEAIRDLQERRGKTGPEKKLVQAISLFEKEKIDQSQKYLDAALSEGLRNPADRAVAHMYLGFTNCIEANKTACSVHFRRMYAELSGYAVTEDNYGYREWFPVLQEVSGPCANLANGRSGSRSQSVLLVTKTLNGGSQLLLNVRPGGTIVFDGRPVGETPPIKLIKVNPGAHTLSISNGRANPIAVDIDVGVGEQIEIRHGVQ